MSNEWVEEGGEFLRFFYKEGRVRTAARISEKALLKCFLSSPGTSLTAIYAANSTAIHEAVRRRLRSVHGLSGDGTLKLLAADFHRSMSAPAIEPVELNACGPLLVTNHHARLDAPRN